MNAIKDRKPKRQLYSVAEANAMLPLLRSILRDVTALANELRDRYERLSRLQSTKGLDRAHEEEVQQLAEEFERGQEKMHEFEHELQKLGVELKDHFSGLIDFRHMHDDREVYLCWRMGETEVTHWHELDSGFSRRKKLQLAATNG
ncbi:MAG: DUF2203 family protein [Gemmataceae bacterium]|nr:DUF2203 family protein [Gemmataceae bacterium]